MVIDLHGLTMQEATAALDKHKTSEKGSLIRIIVGRGTRSKNGPVLPAHVKAYLMNAGISFRQSKIQEGGEGSLEAQF